MKRLMSISLGILFILLMSTATFADIIDLDSTNLSTYSILSGTVLTLNPGDYLVTSRINGTSGSIMIDNASTSLQLGTGVETVRLLHLTNCSFIIGENGGSLTAMGGNSSNAHGINISIGNFTQNGGSTTAIGGSNAHGINIALGNFTQNKGSITTIGGSGSSVYGINVTGAFMAKGDITATGGNGSNAHGINAANTFTQNEGSITTSGGSGSNAYGINVASTFTQNAGNITANGGSGLNAYGMYISSNMSISEKLTIARSSEAASLYVNNIFTMNNESTLVSIIDLSKVDNLASGLVIVRNGIVLNNDITIAPIVQNSYSLLKGESKEMVFLQSTNSTINGTFAYLEDTITLGYEIGLSGDNKNYLLTVIRNNTPKEAFELGKADKKYVDFVDSLYTLLTEQNGGSSSLIKILDDIDNSKSVEEALDIIKGSIPEPLSVQLAWVDGSIRSFNNNQNSLYTKLHALSIKKYTIWLDISYIFGKYDGDKESIREFAYGFAATLGNFGVAAQVNLLDGNIAGNKIFSNGTGFGVTAVASYSLNITNLLNPELGLTFGYIGNSISDGMKQNSIRFGLNVNNMFNLTKVIGIEAKLGLNYTSSSFSENEKYNMAASKYLSLAANFGVNFVFNISNIFKANVYGYADVELLDTNNFKKNLNKYEYEAVAIALAINNNNRVSFGAGAKLMFILADSIGLDLVYDIYINNPYVSNRIKVGINAMF